MDVKTDKSDRAISFRNPKRFFSDLEPAVTARVVASAADIALVIDNGIVKDIAIGNATLCAERFDSQWRGKKWVETVTAETRRKVEELLDPPSSASSVWRQVNHPSSSGVDLPVKYTTIATGRQDQVVAVGRELRALSVLQQRLVEAHQGLERDYDRMRAVEMRYRLLFEAIADAVLVIDSERDTILEANPLAEVFVKRHAKKPDAANIKELFHQKSQRVIENALAEARLNGAAISDRAEDRDGDVWNLHIAAFQVGEAGRYLVRLAGAGGDGQMKDGQTSRMSEVIENLPDGFAIVSEGLDLQSTNRTFARMAGYPGGRIPEGRTLRDFLGRSDTDLNVLIANLRRHGTVRNFSTVFRDRFDVEEAVEVAGLCLRHEKDAFFGFSIRSVARRLETAPRIGEELPSSVDQVTGLVGKVPLKEIIRESSDLIEKLCIEAALEITDDNRASAAEMLGLSRQGLYSKIKRYGIDS